MHPIFYRSIHVPMEKDAKPPFLNENNSHIEPSISIVRYAWSVNMLGLINGEVITGKGP